MGLQNNFVVGDRPAGLGEVLKHVALRIRAASKRSRGMRLSAEEVRALDWAVIRDSTIAGADELWLASDVATYLREQA